MYKWKDIILNTNIIENCSSTIYLSLECDNCHKETKQMVKYLRKHLKEGRKHKFCSSSCSSKFKTTRNEICLNCGSGLIVGQKKYCSRSCSATHTQSNGNVPHRKDSTKPYAMSTKKCISCDTEFTAKGNQKFCSHSCQQRKKSNDSIRQWLNGETFGYTGKAANLKKPIRKYLFETRGSACSVCGWDERHPVDGAILTEIDHIDGDAHNCHPVNLQILCPNCHSKTPNHRARNKKSSRIR